MRNSRSLFCIPALLTCFVMVGAGFAAPYEVHFQSGVFLPEAGRFEVPARADNASPERAHVLIQLNDYLKKGQKEELALAGVDLLQYLPDRAYVASVRRSANADELKALGVRHISPFTVEQKMHPRLSQRDFGVWSEYSQQRRILAIDVMPDVTLDDAELILEQAGCEVGHRFEMAHTLLIAIEPDRAEEIASLDAVLFVNECPPPLDVMNNDVRSRLHVTELRAAPYNLSGQGVTILVYDGGMVDSTHPDFGDRVTWMEAGQNADHSTHVAGTVGGNGPLYSGMAPQARIISGEYDACNPNCLYESANDIEPDYLEARRTHHVELTTNSIGANIDPNNYPEEWFGDYETTSRLLDRLVVSTAGSPLIQFWAAGNERNGTTHGYTTYRCMSVPAGAKNIITCGATTNADAVASFSSWGPTDDGRIKPEVCATGVDVTSCVVGGGYASMDGTSMATPATSGTACLILEKWHQLFPGAADPLPETMKAILINSATDLGSTGPDFQTGFGLVNGLRAVQNLIAGGVLESALEVGETFTHTFSVPAGTTMLDVSLAWSDLPASGNVIPTLVNDLNLTLENPSGTVYYPWILRPASPNLPAITGTDSINVCERVHVAAPAAGTWTLRVTGNLNGGSTQTFGLSANVALVSTWSSITGQIRSSATSQGVPGRVRVIGGSQIAISDTNGNYTISLAANATYTLRAEAYGFVARDTVITPAGGPLTVNLPLNTAQNGTINGIVRNLYGYPLTNAEIRFNFPMANIPSATSGAGGVFTAILPGGTTYEVEAVWDGYSVSMPVLVPENGSINVILEIFHPKFRATGPDAYGYYAYETGDSGSIAQYNWTEISPNAGGAGTLIQGASGNDWVVSVNTPFPIRFYGQTTNSIQVGADGWVRVGAAQTADSVYANRDIPNTRVPNGMICVFWDDLYPYDPANGGDIASYYDQATGRFIIEYHNVPHFTPRTNRTTAQLVFFDTAVRPTLSGDNEFMLQYQSLDYDDGTEDADGTVGIEDFEGDDGLQLVFDGQYDPTCFDLRPQKAILFSPGGIHGLGAVRGELTMIPEPADWSAVTVTLGASVIHPDTNGIFLFVDVPQGLYSLHVLHVGYEAGRLDTIIVAADDTAQTAFTLYRLDPARNLDGDYNGETHQIHLFWDWPLWHETAVLRDGRTQENHLDIFRGFKVWGLPGGYLGTVNDTNFIYTVTQSRAYRFWIEAMYDGGTADTSNNFRITVDLSGHVLNSFIPAEFYMNQNYPNPFNPTTVIEYGLPKASRVLLDVFDVLGRKVAVLQDGIQNAGVYRITFDAKGLGSGVFYYRIRSEGFEKVQKMLLMR